MAVMINCVTCKKSTEPVLDQITNKVYCSVCDTETAVSHFVKVQLQTLKQYKAKNNTFLVKCLKCNKEATPTKKDNDIFCGVCQQPLSHITSIFKKMLFEHLDKLKEDI